jgi:transposase
MIGIDPSRLVFFDETSTPTTLILLRARAARAAGGDLLAGDADDAGIGECLLVRGAVDRPVFETFVERVLVPSLRPGQIVILDNLSVHKSARAKALIQAAGCYLVFLPTYSPDFTPIEQAFAKSKQTLRRVGARSWESIVMAIGEALHIITEADACAFFAAARFSLPYHVLRTPR